MKTKLLLSILTLCRDTFWGIRGIHCVKLILIVFFTSINCLKVSSQIQIGSTINGHGAGDDFGKTVSLSEDGNTLACGANRFSSSSLGPGYVNVYRLNGTSWQQMGGSVYGINNGDGFGRAIDLAGDGDSFVVGTSSHDGTFPNSGMAQVFQFNSGSWQQKGQALFGDEANASLGSSVAISSNGNIIAVGARSAGGGGVRRGQIKIFEWDSTQWVLKGFAINGPSDEVNMGTRLDMSVNGQVLVISGRIGVSILVQIYSWNGSSWTQRGTNVTFPGQVFSDASGGGVSISNDGNVVALKNAERLNVYEWSGSEWLQKGSSISESGIFGIDLTAGGDTLVYGQPGVNTVGTGNGGARILVFNGEQWVLSGNPVYGTQANDRLGSSVAINGSGSIFALGAPGEFSSNDLTAIPGYAKVYGTLCTAPSSNITPVGASTFCTGGSVVLNANTGAGLSYQWSTGDTTASIFVNPSINTTYSVQVADASGCTGTAEINVVVNQPSTASETASACGSYTWNGNTFSQSGTYTWSGTNVAGCDSVVTLILTIIPQPAQPPTACYQTATFNNQTCAWDLSGTQPTQPETACYQTATFNNQTCAWDLSGTQPTQPETACYQTATFNNQTCEWDLTGSPNPVAVTTASACSTYVWNVNGQSYTTSNTYTYFANCQDYQLNLTISPNPTVTFEPDNTTYCNNSGSVDLSGGSPAGGVYSGPGVSNGAFNPAAAGGGLHPVTYTYTNAAGCSNSSSVEFEVAVCTGVEAAAQPELEVRPNPMESSTWVSLKNYTGTDALFNLLLMDATGREVFRKTVSAEVIREGYHLQIPELATGTYMLMLNNVNYTGVKRLVK